MKVNYLGILHACPDKVFVDVEIFDKIVTLQADTGTSVSLLNYHTHIFPSSPALSPVERHLKKFCHQHFLVLGQFLAPMD